MGKKEQDIAAFEALRTRMQENGYRERSAVISVLKANVLAIVTEGPFALLSVVCYMLIWGSRLSAFLPPEQALLVLLLFLLSLPVHEFLHGIGWCAAGRTGFKNIRFGMMWSSLTPYCHCSEPLPAGQYLFGLLLPFFCAGTRTLCGRDCRRKRSAALAWRVQPARRRRRPDNFLLSAEIPEGADCRSSDRLRLCGV